MGGDQSAYRAKRREYACRFRTPTYWYPQIFSWFKSWRLVQLGCILLIASAAQSSPVGVGRFSCNINENHLKKADTDIEGIISKKLNIFERSQHFWRVGQVCQSHKTLPRMGYPDLPSGRDWKAVSPIRYTIWKVQCKRFCRIWVVDLLWPIIDVCL